MNSKENTVKFIFCQDHCYWHAVHLIIHTHVGNKIFLTTHIEIDLQKKIKVKNGWKRLENNILLNDFEEIYHIPLQRIDKSNGNK